GQAHHEAGPALVAVGDLDPAAVAIDDPRGDCQAQAGSAAGGAMGPVEALEDMGQVLGPDTRAIVLDDERRSAAFSAYLDPDASVGRAVPDGVVDEDHHELAEARRIARDNGRLRI